MNHFLVVYQQKVWTLHLSSSRCTCWTFQVNKSQSTVTLKFEGNEYHWKAGENIVQKLESEHFVKQVFPLHGMLAYHQIVCYWSHLNSKVRYWDDFWLIDELKRKKLLKSWALHWWDLTNQPIDEIYLYFGTKVKV